jgi:uncharacterized coiled-coil protein SlyX
MNDDTPNHLGKLTDRVTELELLLTHMQRTIHDLDQVALDQQKQIDKLSSQLSRITLDVGRLQTAGDEVRSPEDEKPPHY